SSNLVVSGAVVANNSAGNSGQILSSQGPGTTPQWINPGSANTLLSSTNTWTATQMYVSSIAVSAPGGVGVTYGVVAGSCAGHGSEIGRASCREMGKRLAMAVAAETVGVRSA